MNWDKARRLGDSIIFGAVSYFRGCLRLTAAVRREPCSVADNGNFPISILQGDSRGAGGNAGKRFLSKWFHQHGKVGFDVGKRRVRLDCGFETGRQVDLQGLKLVSASILVSTVEVA